MGKGLCVKKTGIHIAIAAGTGIHFDTAVVDAFLSVTEKMQAIAEKYR